MPCYFLVGLSFRNTTDPNLSLWGIKEEEMDFSSLFRKALLKKDNKSEPITSASIRSDSKKVAQSKEDEGELGVTDQLREFVKSFTIETFKNYPLQDDQGTTTTLKINDGSSTNLEIVQKDLSEWQERHAMLVLTKVKEISQLRYTLCPRHLKERQFWKIYFMLVKIYVAPLLQVLEKNQQTDKPYVPHFMGKDYPNKFVDWLNHIETVFDCKNIPGHRKVKLVILKLVRTHTNLSEYAPMRWNIQTEQELAGKRKIITWEKIKDELMYELQAIRQAKLRRMATKDEKSLDSGFEVEMAEAKRPTNMSSPSPERKSGSQLDDDEAREV